MPATRSQPNRVLLVDDHEVVRVGLRTVLKQNHSITVAGESATKDDAIQQAQTLNPDVILMDIRLPDGSGVDACREILSAQPATRVIFLTSYSDDDSLLAAILAGAHGYVLKQIDSGSLIRALQSVAVGHSILDPTITQQALQWVRKVSHGQNGPGTEYFSAQEEQVVALVAEGKTNKEIGSDLALSEKTVRNYLANVYRKLGMTRRAQAAAFFIKQQT